MSVLEFPIEFDDETFNSWQELSDYLSRALHASDMSRYQTSTRATAQYPRDAHTDYFGLMYCVLGLNGEAGEVAEEVKKMIRDDGGALTEDRKERLENELGDVLWYLSQACTELGVSLDGVALLNLLKLSVKMQKGKTLA